jgi:hypothetical protein
MPTTSQPCAKIAIFAAAGTGVERISLSLSPPFHHHSVSIAGLKISTLFGKLFFSNDGSILQFSKTWSHK